MLLETQHEEQTAKSEKDPKVTTKEVPTTDPTCSSKMETEIFLADKTEDLCLRLKGNSLPPLRP